MKPITFLYPYRNREPQRIKRSLDSLSSQNCQNFQVEFIDYGSDQAISKEVEILLSNYEFATYTYLETSEQPWNKAKALNFIIKDIASDYCFVADVDIIFHPEFTTVLENIKNLNEAFYFKVGFLSESESSRECKFDDYKIKFQSTSEATGMTLFPVHWIKKIAGFDEFFHFWGSEDTDIHNRLKSAGCKVSFHSQYLYLLHQWHQNFNSKKSKQLTQEVQLSRIAEINHLHLLHNLKNNKPVNQDGWGTIFRSKNFKDKISDVKISVSNEKKHIDYFLFQQLPNSIGKIIEIEINESLEPNTLKYVFKKLMGKKVSEFYTLKEINDQILLHIVSFYRAKPYIYRINENLKSIFFKIKM